MKKIETIWHHLLFTALSEKRFKFTQKEIAERLKVSLGTVNFALTKPASIGAIRKATKFFVLEDIFKLLYFWGSVRTLNRDIIFQTSLNLSISQIEGLIPPQGIYAAYSAAEKILGEPPADYSKVYLYLSPENLEELKKRFEQASNKKASEPNLIVLKMPTDLPQYGNYTDLAQTFVDIWNLKDWYAKDFLKALEEKINGILS